MTSSPVIPILFGGLIVWSIIRRVRRNIGRQPLRPRRAITSIVILSLVSVLIAGLSWPNTHLLFSFGGGLLPGVLLGLAGLRLTRFETTDEGHFYTPNTHIGIALSVLFAGRMVYRLIVLGGADAQNHAPLFQSPLTLVIFGLTVGYYIVYQAGILIHNHDKK
jgi:hypothetical protein